MRLPEGLKEALRVAGHEHSVGPIRYYMKHSSQKIRKIIISHLLKALKNPEINDNRKLTIAIMLGDRYLPLKVAHKVRLNEEVIRGKRAVMKMKDREERKNEVKHRADRFPKKLKREQAAEKLEKKKSDDWS